MSDSNFEEYEEPAIIPDKNPQPSEHYTTDEGLAAVTRVTVCEECEAADDGRECTGECTEKHVVIFSSGTGVGGATLTRTRAIPWEEYSELDVELKEAAIADIDTVIEPPEDWKIAMKNALGAFVSPNEIGVAGAAYNQYREELGELEDYHDCEKNSRSPSEIDEEIFDRLDRTVEYTPVETGEMYLRNGRVLVYSASGLNGSQNATELKLSNVDVELIDLDKITVVPDNIAHSNELSQDDYGFLEANPEYWVQYSDERTQELAESVQWFFISTIRPESLTSRLYSYRKWYDIKKFKDEHMGDGSSSETIRENVESRVESELETQFKKLLDKSIAICSQLGL